VLEVDNLVFTALTPHPPIIISEVGGEERDKAKKTCQAMEVWAQMVKDKVPDTIVLVSPHGTVYQDAITLNEEGQVAGNLAQFGASQVRLSYATDLELASAIKQMSGRHNVPVVGMDKCLAQKYGAKLELDHGALVPLYYLDSIGVRCQLVSVTMGLLPFEELYAFGLAVQQAARLLDKRVVVIASGDLSHRLTPDAPAGYSPEGKLFDDFLVQALQEFKVEDILNVNQELGEKAGECGLRPIIMMLGALDGMDVEARVLSYEEPFGVGYLVAGFTPLGLNPERELHKQLLEQRAAQLKQRRAGESEAVRLARETLEHYVVKGQPWPSRGEERPPAGLEGRAGVFVSIKKHGQLRGCIGTTAPTQGSIIAEIRQNAISAGTRDPRFWPIEEDELADLVYSVDVLREPEDIDGLGQLDPQKYGVIVSSGNKSGLLLPMLEGVDTVEAQVAIAKQKAGLQPEQPCQLQRFEVVRYH
jgi:AmmeMemoRadiSam system protein A